MKKLLLSCLALVSLSVFAAGPDIDNLSRSDLKKIGNEFGANFSHNVVAAPETNGLWGVEVGLAAGRTSSPDLKDTINSAGGKGSDFNNLYTAGLMARVHIPFDIFFEASALPSQKISEVDVSNKTLGLGWNVGAFMGLPLDVAIGANTSDAEIQFKQVINNANTGNTDVNSTIKMSSQAKTYWVGVSKTFLFITPYLKLGSAKTETDVKSSASSIFNYSSQQSDSVSSSGSYLALGANLQFFLFRFGVEASQIVGVKRIAGKFSLSF